MASSCAAAVARLRDAAEALVPTGEEQDPARQGDDVWQVLCRQCLQGWVAAVERDFAVATSALRSCRRATGWDLRVRRFEEAVWRLVSVRDRLGAVAALALGTRVLKRQNGGVRFWPDGGKLQRRIASLSPESPTAMRVISAWKAIDDHEAVDLRNTITHKVPSVSDVPPLVILEDVYCVAGRPLRYGHHYLVGRKIGSTLDPSVLLQEGREAAADLLGLLIDATDALAELMLEEGALHPPRVCIYECKPGFRDCELTKLD